MSVTRYTIQPEPKPAQTSSNQEDPMNSALPRVDCVAGQMGGVDRKRSDPVIAQPPPDPQNQGDNRMPPLGSAPACDVCGTVTVLSGSRFKCVNCGNAMTPNGIDATGKITFEKKPPSVVEAARAMLTRFRELIPATSADDQKLITNLERALSDQLK